MGENRFDNYGLRNILLFKGTKFYLNLGKWETESLDQSILVGDEDEAGYCSLIITFVSCLHYDLFDFLMGYDFLLKS